MARLVYRNLLKALKSCVAQETANPQFKEYVATEFRKHKDLADLASIQVKLNLAKDYTTLITGIRHHKELLLSYNIGVDRNAEQAARLKDTANRVGLQMPVLDKESQ